MRRLLAVCLLALYTAASHADHKPLWELHAGLATLHVPHYRGSNAEHNLVIPFPSLTYRGEYLKANEEGVRGLLFTSERNKLDISFGMSLPATSDEDDARAGMPELDTTLEVGPSLVTTLWQSNHGNTGVWLHTPLRMAFSFDDLNVHDQGLILSPFIQWRHKWHDWRWGVAAGISYANERYHDYYYKVSNQYVTSKRHEYQPDAGYSGSRVTLSATKHFARSWVALFTRYDDLSNVAFEDSPLVERNSYWVAGIVYTYRVKESETTSHHSDHRVFE